MKKHKLIFVAGARPNFMKVAPLIRLLAHQSDFSFELVHTGQHYDDQLSGQFFRDLELPSPEYHLCVGSGSHAQQTAEIMKRMEPVLISAKPDAVVVLGDVNSTMAAAVVASKLQIPVIHVEAGLRSFDRSMPEEINRVITDAVSDLLLTTEESGRRNLLNEGIPQHRIHFVGNLMIDSLHRSLAAARQSDILRRLSINGHPFGLVTLHRPSNVDDPEQLEEIVDALREISQTVPLFFPVHPRTRLKLERVQSRHLGNISLLDPLGYLDFLCLMSKCCVVLTDSGGVQEETTVLGIPCLTLRDNTERPVTIEQGTNTLAGTRRSTIIAAWNESRAKPKVGRVPPLWDGAAAGRCLAALRNYFVDRGPKSKTAPLRRSDHSIGGDRSCVSA